jgi:2-phospho-L-lactate guanylyltransferase
MKTVGLVPVGALAAAKSRLRGVLGTRERRALVFHYAPRVAAALADSGGVALVGVASPDLEILTFFADLSGGDSTIVPVQTDGGGLNDDLEQGRRWALGQGAEALLVVLADLPLLTPRTVAMICEQASAAPADPCVLLAPDRHERGTNALLLCPADALPFAFGEGSLARHVALARARGIEPMLYHSSETGCDLDTPADLRAALARGAWLPEGVAHRLRAGA